jgi:hypothetical protein
VCYQRRVTPAANRGFLRRSGGFACVFALWALLLPSAAHAYEDQLSLGLGLGYARATRPGLPHNGGSIELEAGFGLSDTLSARAAVSYGLHPGTSSLSMLGFAGELIYIIDVLAVVPYFGAGLDGLASSHGPKREWRGDFGAHPVVGVDWLLNRDLALGLEARPVFVLSDLSRAPVYFSVNLTASWLLDL